MAETPDEILPDPSPPPAEVRRKWPVGRLVFYGFLLVWAGTALWNLFKPLPNGTSVRGEVVETPLEQLRYLTYVSGADVFGAPVVRQEIFDAMLRMVGEARQYIVLDFFLFNAQRGALPDARPHRELSVELRDALLARKRTVTDGNPRGQIGRDWRRAAGQFHVALGVVRDADAPHLQHGNLRLTHPDAMRGQHAEIQAGAGIVADSVPAAEYEETQDKARALLQALEMAQGGI